MGCLVIIPTLNEEENIAPLLKNILSLKENLDILVVDDNSDDGTFVRAQNLRPGCSRVKVISNYWPQRGLAYCYKCGFDYALKAGYDWVICMDADFSHDPGDIPKLLNQIDAADCIIGSRYVKGANSGGLGIVRFMISRFANFYIRRKLSLDIADATGGFNCYSSRILQRLDFSSVSSTGFVFQVEMKYLAARGGFRFKEVPISFNRRKAGTSKFSLKVIFEALHIIRSLEVES